MKSRKKYSSTPKSDLYQQVTDRMIALLEKGVTPWRCPWKGYGQARNYATNHIYSGINALLMNLTPHPIPYFMSFKQAQALGGHIRKGAKSEMVYFYKTYYKDASGKSIDLDTYHTLEESGKKPQRIAFLKYFRVFNIADVENINIDIPTVQLQEHERIERCENIVKGYSNCPSIVYENANQAYYHPVSDKVNMPTIGQFDTAQSYYAVLFHELIHSTGHEFRLNRDGITKHNQFKSPGYSKEELIAELGASFLCAHAHIDSSAVTQNSASYLQGWLSVLKADKKLIFQAAAQAQKAVDYMRGSKNLHH